MLARAAKSCRRLSKLVEGYQGLSRAVKRFKGLSRANFDYSELLVAFKSF